MNNDNMPRYREHPFLINEYECDCPYQKRGGDPSCYDWECTLYDVYLGKYRAKRCGECIDAHGDKYLIRRGHND